jgi:hypothetical protein
MKIIIRILSGLVLVAIGFATGYPIGHGRGFTTGSEWAFVQASIISREFGLFMPVNFVEGNFRVVLKQPLSISKRSRQLAEKYESDFVYGSYGEKELVKNAKLIRSTYLMQ